MRTGVMTTSAGIVLAAGAGARYGAPKALARTDDGELWTQRAVSLLRDAGCDRVFVAVGAAVVEVPGAEVVQVPDWRSGVSAALRAGLAATGNTDASVALVTLVDLPAMPVAAMRRVLTATTGEADLVRAVYDGLPGHPVALGRAHWRDIADRVSGDTGAGAYLRAHGATAIECGDLWDGRDIDSRPPHLEERSRA